MVRKTSAWVTTARTQVQNGCRVQRLVVRAAEALRRTSRHSHLAHIHASAQVGRVAVTLCDVLDNRAGGHIHVTLHRVMQLALEHLGLCFSSSRASTRCPLLPARYCVAFVDAVLSRTTGACVGCLRCPQVFGKDVASLRKLLVRTLLACSRKPLVLRRCASHARRRALREHRRAARASAAHWFAQNPCFNTTKTELMRRA